MNQLPHITKKQFHIIQLLFKFRFLNRSHIQQLLHHKDEARINHWLKDLNQKQYISRSYATTFPENTKPAVYHISTSGIAYLKSQNTFTPIELQKLYREDSRSDSFIAASLLLCTIYIDLRDKSNDLTRFTVFLKSDYPKHQAAMLLQDLRPSSYIRQETPERVKTYFLEILGDIPAEHQRKRLKKYLAFYQSNEWEGATGEPYPTVLIICPNDATLATIRRFTKTKLKQQDETDFKLHLTTTESVERLGLTGDIWQPVTYKSDV